MSGMLTPEDYHRANAPYAPRAEASSAGSTPSTTSGEGRVPFAGLLRRGWAFILDCLLLYILASLLERSFRSQLLHLNPWLPWLSYGMGFLYFWLATGPVGRGRTVGKLILHLTVADGEGRPLSTGASFKRELLKCAVLLTQIGSVGLAPDFVSLIFPPGGRYAVWISLLLISLTGFAWLIALAISIGIDPYRRGLHDRLGGAYVTFSPIPDSFQDALAASLDPLGERRVVWSVRVALVLFVVTSIAINLVPLRMATLPATQQAAAKVIRANQEHDLNPYQVAKILMPSPELRRHALESVAAARQRAATAGDDVPTTHALLDREDADGETVLIMTLRRNGPFGAADLDDAGFRQKVERMREELWHELLQTTTTTAAADYKFAVWMFEPFQMLFRGNTMLRGRVHGAANPAAGALDYEVIPLPSESDAATTTTAGR